MPIPKRTASTKNTTRKTTSTYSDSHYEQSPNYSSNEKKSSWCWKSFLIIFWIFIVLVIISAINDSSSSSSSSSYSNTTSYTTTSTTTNSYEKDWKCKWSDWYRYTKPVHAYCDGGKTPLWWKCNVWYTAKSENDKTWINSSRYCAANCSNFTCFEHNNCNYYENQIPKSVNQYSSQSVNNYNAKVAAYNRCLSERCYCR